ncbi:hypothetical protein JYQ62_00415 [Nostoc sp. UHCC 0702]|nr:hypothetical protein JYQ62_00415 [Nostoc sp. UHCC 0702]
MGKDKSIRSFVYSKFKEEVLYGMQEDLLRAGLPISSLMIDKLKQI